MTWGCDICVAGGGGRPGPESAVVMNAGVWVWWGVAWACVGLVYLFQWFESPVKDVEVLLFVLVAGALVFEEFDEPEPSFLPLSPHRLFMLRLIGFRSFLSCPPFPSAAILASISAFFFSISEACADMATSLFAFPSPGLKVLLHIILRFTFETLL